MKPQRQQQRRLLLTHLAFHEYIEEVVVQVAAAAGHEVSQHGLAPAQPQPGQVAGAGALVVQAPALRAGQQVQELVRVRGHRRGGQGCPGHTQQVTVSLGVRPLFYRALHARTVWK